MEEHTDLSIALVPVVQQETMVLQSCGLVFSRGGTFEGPSTAGVSLIGSSIAVVVVVVVAVVEKEQVEHKHKSLSSCFGRTRFIQARYSEKKRSPLSGAKGSVFRKGPVETPVIRASSFMYSNSEWLK